MASSLLPKIDLRYFFLILYTRSIFQNKLNLNKNTQIINRLKKPKIVMHYDPETAPVGDLEFGVLVFLFSLIANMINQKVSLCYFNWIVACWFLHINSLISSLQTNFSSCTRGQICWARWPKEFSTCHRVSRLSHNWVCASWPPISFLFIFSYCFPC